MGTAARAQGDPGSVLALFLSQPEGSRASLGCWVLCMGTPSPFWVTFFPPCNDSISESC